MKSKFNLLNTVYYVLGFFIVGLGVNLMNLSNLGLGAWDTVTFNIHSYFLEIHNVNPEFLKVGYVSAVISLLIMLAVLLYRRDVKYLIMIIPVVLMGTVINFWYYMIFDGITVDLLILKLLLFSSGVLLIPLGLVLVVKSSYPAFVFDEWTFMLSEILRIKNFAKTRLIIEIIGVSIGAIFGYFTFFATEGNFGTVSVGTIVVAFIFGPIMQFYLKVLKVEKGSNESN